MIDGIIIKSNQLALVVTSQKSTIFQEKNCLLFVHSIPDYESIARELIKSGANLDNQNNHGSTPLYSASFYGKLPLVIHINNLYICNTVPSRKIE